MQIDDNVSIDWIMRVIFFRKLPFAIKSKKGEYFPVKNREVTKADVIKHLRGLHNIGAYNSKPDGSPNGGTCHWACIDFDSHEYTKIAKEISERAYDIEDGRKIRVETLFEPSESKGSHVWFFFEDSIKTMKAYAFITGVITENNLTVGRDSKIDVFPRKYELTRKKISWQVRIPRFKNWTE